MCATGGLVWRAHAKPGVPHQASAPSFGYFGVNAGSFSWWTGQGWVKTQQGLVYRSRSEWERGNEIQICFILFIILDRNKPAISSCSRVFCNKWLRPLVSRKGWEMTGQ